VAIDGQDILGYPSRCGGHGTPETLRYVGSTGAGDWELAVLANGQQVPGGLQHSSRGQRRYVAYYGYPETTDLGVLANSPAETRQSRFAEAYAGDGSAVIFEIIVSA
jgi:hypothetical protein